MYKCVAIVTFATSIVTSHRLVGISHVKYPIYFTEKFLYFILPNTFKSFGFPIF